MSRFLLILGVAALSAALRSFRHPVPYKLGTLCILATSYLLGESLTGRWQVGALCAASWVFLPWLEIVMTVRRLRLPAARELEDRRPPSREFFPELREWTEALEEHGFEALEDAGWSWDEQDHFVRLLHKPGEPLLASVSLVEQNGLAFSYVSLSSREKNGTLWGTWDYPFAYSMRFPPAIRMNRIRRGSGVAELIEGHQRFLARHGVTPEQLAPCSPQTVRGQLQGDLEAQIAHNLSTGLLLPAPEGKVRYSWRGLVFLWCQFLRDFVRLS